MIEQSKHKDGKICGKEHNEKGYEGPLYAVCRRGCDVIASILHNSGAEIDLYFEGC